MKLRPQFKADSIAAILHLYLNILLLPFSFSLSINYQPSSVGPFSNFKQGEKAPAAFVTPGPSQPAPYSTLFVKQSSTDAPTIFHVDGTIGPKGNGDCEDLATCHEEYKIFYGGIRSKLRGMPGEKGKPGPPGPQGEQGPSGPQGIKGERGLRGDTGQTGPPGKSIEGPIGPIGIPGLPGPVGEKGDPGDPGEKGDSGPKGERGYDGRDGYNGTVGPQGYKGSKGDKGESGPIGPQGRKGRTGPQGDKGDQGDSGPKGDPGPRGFKGDTGRDGPPGDSPTPEYIKRKMREIVLDELEKIADEVRYGALTMIPLINSVTVLNSKEVCLAEYGAYSLACSQNEFCSSQDCANSVEVLKCCYKTSKVGEASANIFLNITPEEYRWIAMDKNPPWLEIKQNLLIKTNLCKINGYGNTVRCPIPDNSANLSALIDEFLRTSHNFSFTPSKNAISLTLSRDYSKNATSTNISSNNFSRPSNTSSQNVIEEPSFDQLVANITSNSSLYESYNSVALPSTIKDMSSSSANLLENNSSSSKIQNSSSASVTEAGINTTGASKNESANFTASVNSSLDQIVNQKYLDVKLEKREIPAIKIVNDRDTTKRDQITMNTTESISKYQGANHPKAGSAKPQESSKIDQKNNVTSIDKGTGSDGYDNTKQPISPGLHESGGSSSPNVSSIKSLNLKVISSRAVEGEAKVFKKSEPPIKEGKMASYSSDIKLNSTEIPVAAIKITKPSNSSTSDPLPKIEEPVKAGTFVYDYNNNKTIKSPEYNLANKAKNMETERTEVHNISKKENSSNLGQDLKSASKLPGVNEGVSVSNIDNNKKNQFKPVPEELLESRNKSGESSQKYEGNSNNNNGINGNSAYTVDIQDNPLINEANKLFPPDIMTPAISSSSLSSQKNTNPSYEQDYPESPSVTFSKLNSFSKPTREENYNFETPEIMVKGDTSPEVIQYEGVEGIQRGPRYTSVMNPAKKDFFTTYSEFGRAGVANLKDEAYMNFLEKSGGYPSDGEKAEIANNDQKNRNIQADGDKRFLGILRY